MNYRYVNVTLGFFSLVVCLILLLYQFLDKSKDKSGKWFSGIIISNIFMTLGDVFDNALRGSTSAVAYYLEVFFSIILYFIGVALLMFTICGWIENFIVSRVKISKWWMKITSIMMVCQLILACTMPITKFCYIERATNTFSRSNIFYLTIVFPYIIYVLLICMICKYYKAFHKRELIFLGGFVTVPMFADVVQIMNGKYLILCPAVSLGIIVLTLFIQQEREREKEQQMNEVVITKNQKLEEMRTRQETLNQQLIDVLCGAVEAKDIYTRGHSMRVAEYAREIMYRLGGDEQAQEEVYCIGILHDIGKISIKDEIINKKEHLTDEEYEQIKLHTIAGYQILRGVNIIPDLAVGARWHHERYDGSGYPNGLAGENIPLIARIISVADAYDAMASTRSYHEGMTQSYVREQIAKGMGTQFDPKIAQIMLDMIDDDLSFEMRPKIDNHVPTILMIDDDPFIHDLVDRMMADEKYVFTFASSGEEGIELLKENKYDICLLDKEMSGMNGFEVLEWIHRHARKMKVIFLTGDKDIETIYKSEKLGAVDYISKPINVRILKESIRSVLAH